ncbi:MAG: aldose 1-epimerase family protein [Bacteroidetes bacterium]|nr:aldose 1-epimerase family protein [Bacteroidota bacterium]
MVKIYGKKWKKNELLSYVGDLQQIAGATPFMYTQGKARGVNGIRVNTGGGLCFTVLPGRGMDIPEAYYKGVPLHFLSQTGITSPVYYEEQGTNWLRSFFAGLLTSCGITNSGPASVDMEESFGLHGRISNTEAEDLCINQEWEDDEFTISLKGKIREAKVFFENMILTRTIETKLGWKKFRMIDVIENIGFDPQPNLMLYHINFGFPLLGPDTKLIAPVIKTKPRDEEAEKDMSGDECFIFEKPRDDYNEKVFFHDIAADSDGNTFAALLNENIGDGTPLGIVLRFNKKELPAFCEWKIMRKSLYALGLEPGVVLPVGRGNLRQKNDLPILNGQESYTISMEFEVLDSLKEFAEIKKEASTLMGLSND